MINSVKQQISRLCYFFATGCGIGTLGFIPVGTVSSLVAIPIWWGILYFYSYKEYLIFLIFGIIFSIYCCDKTNKIIGIHDHKSIVLDEFVGMWVTLIIVPTYNWLWIFFAFVLFRILDIMKPWPISWCDRMIKGGFGIVFDDILAGIVSICILLILMKIF